MPTKPKFEPFGPRMDPKLKAKWIAALQTGGYRHGKGTLKSASKTGKTVSHCCLGVLAEVCKMKIVDDRADGAILVGGKSVEYRPVKELIGDHAAAELIAINDDDDTRGYKAQIQYIKDNL